jgi:hypothetical protein
MSISLSSKEVVSVSEEAGQQIGGLSLVSREGIGVSGRG